MCTIMFMISKSGVHAYLRRHKFFEEFSAAVLPSAGPGSADRLWLPDYRAKLLLIQDPNQVFQTII